MKKKYVVQVYSKLGVQTFDVDAEHVLSAMTAGLQLYRHGEGLTDEDSILWCAAKAQLAISAETGKPPCPACGGSGRWSSDIPCSRCEGTGREGA